LVSAIVVWFIASMAASALLPKMPVAGVLAALAGGIAFGVLSARRADPEKVRIRRRRRRSSPTV